MGYFGAYEFLVYVVPGGIVLFFVIALFPRIRALFGKEPVNVGGLVLFLVIAFVLGQLIQTLAIYSVQYAMTKAELAYRTNTVLFTDTTVLSATDRALLVKRLKEDFDFPSESLQHAKGDPSVDDNLRNEWRRMIGKLRTKVIREKRTDRLEVYGQNFAMNMSLTAAFTIVLAMLIVVSVVSRSTRLSLKITAVAKPLRVLLFIVVVLAIGISLERVAMFDRLFAEELFGSYLYGSAQH